MKKLTILFLSIMSVASINAQSSNYKKIMEERSSVTPDVFFAQLKEFQKENTQFSNVYYQMGKAELYTFSDLDPIVERVASRQYIYNAKTNFALAKNFVDEKELSKNPDWYDAPDLKQKDSVRVLAMNSIDGNYQSTIDYADYYEKLLIHYDKAVSHYLKAQQAFIEINTSADNLRQLFLGADDSLKLAVKQVGVSFDSSMFHLDIYRDTYQLLPHFVKRQVNVNFQHIDHFRMNGITPTNFLADDIDVWNYSEWSERFLNQIVEEVDGLQDEIKTAFTFFIETNDRMVNGEECLQANIDDLKFQRIINLVTKYDNESVLVDIFKYLITKLDYGNQLVYEKNCNDFESSPTDDFLSRKGRIYKNLFDAFLVTDSLASYITTTNHGQESFQWFFDEMLDGENGSQVFAEEQIKENQNSFREELQKIIGYKNDQLFVSDSVNLCFSVDEKLLIEGVRSDMDSLCVIKKIELSDSLHILSTKRDDSYSIIGGRQEGYDYNIKWEVESYKNSSIDYFKMVSDSSFVIGGYADKAWVKNIRMNGAESKQVLLKSADTIVNVTYSELKGELTILQAQEGNVYTLSSSNFSGAVTSSTAVELPGRFISMIRQEQEMWLFSVSDEDGISILNATILNESSKEITNQLSYSLSSQLQNSFVVKNDNKSFTLIGFNALANDEIIYALLDYEENIQNEQIF
ncbi:MAG: hypothetical protein AB8B73_12905 [Ekhidna sp.]